VSIFAIPARDPQFEANVTIFGNWWVSESLRLSNEGLEEATFMWHPQVVKRFSENFDYEFEALCKMWGVDKKQSRLRAIQELDDALHEL